jgi:hypothetical protein
MDWYSRTERKRTMKLNELTKAQKEELKQALLLEREGDVSFDELCDCDQLVTDEELEAKWGGTTFTEDDFFCTAGK